MRSLYRLGLLIICLLIGVLFACLLFSTFEKREAHIEQMHTNVMELSVSRVAWGGFIGVHGFIGFRRVGYVANLVGTNNTFVNPYFLDISATSKCFGTITLNKQANKVTLNMNLSNSGEGSNQILTPHPANGDYPIKSFRVANEREIKFFDEHMPKQH